MPELLLEVGTEELPASAVRKAFTELAAKIRSALIEEGLLDDAAAPVSMGSPRRLIVSIPDLPLRQADSTKEQRGPGLKGAYDAEGKPTQALLGFCRGQSVSVDELRQDGQYVWVTKQIPGRPTAEILAEILPKAIRSLTFDKTMRWGSSKMRFARPIRWILAAFDGGVVPFDIEGVHASAQSFGHRFYSPAGFEAKSLEELLKGLSERHVEPNPAKRRQMIAEHLPIGEEERVELPEALLEENVFLTEWPVPIKGTFSEEFLGLPDAVLTTVMAKHEKMFPVKNLSDDLTDRFIFVRNSGEDASVTKGCEWVLNARLNDALFFYEEDGRHSMDYFLEETQGIVFQEKLGTVHARSERLSKLAATVAVFPHDSSEELEDAGEAGRYAKADLSTGLVSELTSLQGVIGGIYARRANLSDAVCWAISTQYDPSQNPNPEDVPSRTAVRLVMADQIDKLAGYLGIGLEPTGSSDPYGLRRAVTILIEAAWNWPGHLLSFDRLFQIASSIYGEQGVLLDVPAGLESLARLFAARYVAMMPDVRHDILEASLLSHDIHEVTAPQAVRFRTQLMGVMSENEAFVQTATRPLNILAAARKKELSFDPHGLMDDDDIQSLDSDSANRLLHLANQADHDLAAAIKAGDETASLDILLSFQNPINEFFDETMVIAEDEAVRFARLTLVRKVGILLLRAGDFTKIVFKGLD